jgi:hypothetical protein
MRGGEKPDVRVPAAPALSNQHSHRTRSAALPPHEFITLLGGMTRFAGQLFQSSNPQDRSGSSNGQDMTQPRAFNPQDVR